MAFVRQLRLLLWKNFTLRRRQPIRVLVEFLWPLVLFFILMAVRLKGAHRDSVDNKEECHYYPQALPSAGTMAFLQSYMCNLNNHCYSPHELDGKEGFKIGDHYKDSVINQLMKGTEVLLNSGLKSEDILNLGQDMSWLLERSMAAGRQAQISGASVQTLADLLTSQAGLANQLGKVDSGLSTEVVSGILSMYPDTTKIISQMSQSQMIQLSEVVKSLLAMTTDHPDISESEATQMKTLLCQDRFLVDYVQFSSPAMSELVVSEVCKLSVSQTKLLVEDLMARVDRPKIAGHVDDIIAAFGGIGSVTTLTSMMKLFNDLETMDKLGGVVSQISQSLQTVRWDVGTARSGGVLSGVGSIMCGGNTVPFDFSDIQTRIMDNQRVQDTRKNRIDSRFSIIKDNIEKKRLNPTCKNLFEELEQSVYTRVIWRELKPIVLGVITYAPDTPVTRQIVHEAMRTFRYMQTMADMLNTTEHTLPDLENFVTNDVLPLQKIIDSPACEIFASLATSPEFKSRLPKDLSNLLTALSLMSKDPCPTLRKRFSRKNVDVPKVAKFLKDINKFLSELTPYLKCIRVKDKFIGLKDATELEKVSLKLIGNRTLLAALSFDNIGPGDDKLPTVVKYRIRMDADRVETSAVLRDRYRRPSGGHRFKNFAYWFIYIQDMVDSALVQLQTNTSSSPGVYMKQFPYPCFRSKWYAFSMVETMPLFMVITWLFTVAMIIRGVVYEKETRLKEVMKIMGLGNGVHWLAWFITSICFMMLSALVITLMLKVGLLLERADISLVLVFFLGVCMSTTAQCFLISVFFNKANLAAVCGGFIYFISYLPYTQLAQWVGTEDVQTWHFTVGCLFSNVAMGMSCMYLSVYEEQVTGAQWSNFGESPVLDDVFSLRASIAMMYLDAVIYLLLTWYIEAVFPGQYGMPRKPWFFLQRSYWCGHSKPRYTDCHHSRSVPSQYIESEPRERRVGVSVRNLGKIFHHGNKVAVDGLSLNFYEGQITSFLGHNGAGKTTTMSILTGLFPPTSGTVEIYGQDIHDKFDIIRRSLGMCPQHNVLFDRLTVEEHIWFYARLKGCSDDVIRKELDQMVEAVGLPDKRSSTSDTLSGGMKRKLSVAIAFVGGSKTVILDEPTAGVDPNARRAIWELLLKFKKNRTIILSTHHMDEADVLGDRIAIISHGKLCAAGSSMFLKQRFGTGHYLTLALSEGDLGRTNARNPDTGETAIGDSGVIAMEMIQPKISDKKDDPKEVSQADRLTAFIKSYFPSASLVENKGTELCYRLPEETRHAGTFQKFFQYLETSHHQMGVSSYGISDTSLEEVFLKVADGIETNKQPILCTNQVSETNIEMERPRNESLVSRIAQSMPRGNRSSQSVNLVTEDYCHNNDDMIMNDGFTLNNRDVKMAKFLVLHQVFALIVKRFHHMKRSKKGFVCEILLPAAFICLALVASIVLPSFKDDPSLELQPWMYEPRVGTSHLYTFFNSVNQSNPVSRKLEELILNSPNYGTRCMNPDKHSIPGKPCHSYQTDWSESVPFVDNNDTQCTCKNGEQVCPASIWKYRPSTKLLKTNDFIWNLTERDVSTWLLKTRRHYEEHLYGGFSVGHTSNLYSSEKQELVNIFKSLKESDLNIYDILPSKDYADMLEQLVNNGYTSDNVQVWYSKRGYHASVSYLNAINNVLLRGQLSEDKNPMDYGIVTYNHPFKVTQQQFNGEGMFRSGIIDLVVSTFVIFAMSFIPASFVIFLIEERISKSKHLQILSGVSPATYWLANWLWDMLNYAVPACICLLLFIAFDKQAYVSDGALPCLAALFMLYGWAMVPAMYQFSHFLNVPSSAFVLLSCMNVFLGSVSTLTTFVLETMIGDTSLQSTNELLKKLFLCLPHYCLGRGMMDMAYYKIQADIYTRYGEKLEYNLFQWDIVGRNLFSMMLLGFIFNILNILIEYRQQISKAVGCARRRATVLSVFGDLDHDVIRERERVMSGSAQTDKLRLEQLTKVYNSPTTKGTFTAVNGVYFGVPKGQCFGLLGINGAGKTSLFKMLTGDINISHGQAYVDQKSINTDLRSAQKLMGYCPQFDALDPLLSGTEHLQFYARIKGIATDDVNDVTELASKRLSLTEYADRIACTYSGGNRRKLATAIALIGNPAVLFLDEPTTGMDPKARRFLWNCINSVVKAGTSVVLTSHSMEECEALCSRLAIMVNGSLQCIGTAQHLKHRFGSGYTLILRIKPGVRVETAAHFMAEHLPAASLRESHHNILHYQLNDVDHRLSLLFKAMEEAKEKEIVEDFSVAQTTLDQVFINFARSQTDLQDCTVKVKRNGSGGLTRGSNNGHTYSATGDDHSSVEKPGSAESQRHEHYVTSFRGDNSENSPCVIYDYSSAFNMGDMNSNRDNSSSAFRMSDRGVDNSGFRGDDLTPSTLTFDTPSGLSDETVSYDWTEFENSPVV